MTQPTPAQQQRLASARRDLAHVWLVAGATAMVAGLLTMVVAIITPAGKDPAPATTSPSSSTNQAGEP